MSAERFTLDTNILVYAVDRTEGWKHELAIEIVDRSLRRPCVLTLQAVAEFVMVVIRKRPDQRAFAISQGRDWLASFPIVVAGEKALSMALGAVESARLALFDALLLATARESGCKVVLSEDMRDSSRLLDVAVRNPFQPAGLPADLRRLLGLT
jgi:predicted nucleic acid-binding protein